MDAVKLVQCVPNFSEGRRPWVVEALADAVRRTPGVLLADHSADCDHNRCVLTFIGTPGPIRTAILSAAEAAIEHIDVSNHTGEHPRVGAVDVVPIIPLKECEMIDCVELSRSVARDIAENLRLPVYLYANSASVARRTELPAVRRGGIEALRKHGLTGDRCPDCGPAKLHPTAGATIIGARGPLVAFNVNLDTADRGPADGIASMIRSQRGGDPRLDGVRAIGVELSSRGLTQVSMNITKPRKCSIPDIYGFVSEAASELGVRIAGAELIGTIRSEHLDPAVFDTIPNLALSPWQVLDTWVDKYESSVHGQGPSV